jgi:hypothetical protein
MDGRAGESLGGEPVNHHPELPRADRPGLRVAAKQPERPPVEQIRIEAHGAGGEVACRAGRPFRPLLAQLAQGEVGAGDDRSARFVLGKQGALLTHSVGRRLRLQGLALPPASDLDARLEHVAPVRGRALPEPLDGAPGVDHLLPSDPSACRAHFCPLGDAAFASVASACFLRS